MSGDNIQGLIRLNKWEFCPHGHECCNVCRIDLRYLNDGVAEDDLRKPNNVCCTCRQGCLYITDSLQRDHRKGLSVAGRFVVRVNKSKKRGVLFLCKEHSARDCQKCFDFEKFVKANAKTKVAGKVEDRDRILRLLAALGVSSPELKKLVTPALEKKLTLSLDYAQSFVLLSDTLPLVPADLPEWKVSYFHRCGRNMNGVLIHRS